MAIWLSYSAYSQYKKCPKNYDLQRITKKPPPVKDSKHNAIVGTVVQQVFEDFYNQEVWRKKAQTSEVLLAKGEEYLWQYMEKEYVNFDDPRCRFAGPTEPLNEILQIIPKVLTGIKREKFIGPYAKSEIKLRVRFGLEDFLLGYVDFIIRKKDGTLLLLDGKASKHREKYIDETQLHYYALMFFLRYKKLPDKMGFFYYRFADDPEKAMDWIPIDKAKIRDLRKDIEEVLYQIKKKQFTATPSTKSCQWCPYQTVCSERLGQKRANQQKRLLTSKKPVLDIDFKGKSEIMLGFGVPDKK